jgi:dienelactone hydrolase
MVPKTLPDNLTQWAAANGRTIEQKTFPGVGHGFAARPSAKDKIEIEQFQAAFEYACAALERK